MALLDALGHLGISAAEPLGKPSATLEQARLSEDSQFCLNFSRQLVSAKLLAQQEWFEQLGEQYPQARCALSGAVQQLQVHLQHLPSIDNLENLRGLEDSIASAYFAGLRAVVPENWHFTRHDCGPTRNPFNVLLSLTYTLIGAEISTALHCAGFDPRIGFYHQPSRVPEALASDLLVPLRSWADRFCLQLVAQQTLTGEHFSRSSSACLLDSAGRAAYYGAYAENAAPLHRSIDDSVKALGQCTAEFADAV